jgi:hypothetical protein
MHLEAMTVAMSSEHTAFIIEYNLSASFEISLKELGMFFSKNGRH